MVIDSKKGTSPVVAAQAFNPSTWVEGIGRELYNVWKIKIKILMDYHSTWKLHSTIDNLKPFQDYQNLLWGLAVSWNSLESISQSLQHKTLLDNLLISPASTSTFPTLQVDGGMVSMEVVTIGTEGIWCERMEKESSGRDNWAGITSPHWEELQM